MYPSDIDDIVQKMRAGSADVEEIIEDFAKICDSSFLLTYRCSSYEVHIGFEGREEKYVKKMLKILEHLNLSCAPSHTGMYALSDGFVCNIFNYAHCEGQLRVRLDELETKLSKDDVRAVLQDLSKLHELGFWHYYSHQGDAHWYVFLPSQTLVLNVWNACQPLGDDETSFEDYHDEILQVLAPYMDLTT